MILPLKPFEIHIDSFSAFIKTIPNTDGIVIDEQITIVETQPLTDEDITKILDYYNSLTEELELSKINYPKLLLNKIMQIKQSMLNKNYDNMSSVERKIFLNVPLTKEDEESLWL